MIPPKLRRLLNYLKTELADVAVLPRSTAGRVVFFLILILGASLRVSGLDWGLSYKQPIGPPHHDEPHVMHYLTISWEKYKEEFDEYEIVRPVFLWRLVSRPIYTLGERLGLNSPDNLVFEYAVPRSLNSLFGILGLLIIYGLGVRLGGVRAGLLAMALLGVLPGHWYYSQLLKGDLLVTTYDAVLLLCAIRIYDRGTRFWYIIAGLTAGLGLATKPSVFVMLPVVLVAHVARAVSERKLRTLVSLNAWLTIFSATGIFLLLYPYPFLDYARWWRALTQPTIQHFHINWKPSVNSFLTSWREYNEPPRVFMEMIFGEALRRAFPLMAALFLLLTLFALRAKKAVPYLLVVLAAFLVFHSLSFTGALDDRYAMPLAIFVVLFPAVLAGSYSFLQNRWRIVAATTFALVLLVYTASVTWATYPLFAIGTDIRLQVVDFLENKVKPDDVIGEFEASGRQSLPFNREKINSIRLRTHEEDPHIFLFGEPEYMVVPVEPNNYDHAFRYQLYTPALKQEFDQYVTSFRLVRRFGDEPHSFGRPLPRLLSTPIFDVYQYSGHHVTPPTSLLTSTDQWLTPDGIRLDPKTFTPSNSSVTLLNDRLLNYSELKGKLLTFTFDISDIAKLRQEEELPKGVFTPFLLFDGNKQSLTKPLDLKETDAATVVDNGRLGVIVPFKLDELKRQDTVRVALYFRPEGRIDTYLSRAGRLLGRAITPPQKFSSAQFGFALAAESSPLPSIHLQDITLQTPLDIP